MLLNQYYTAEEAMQKLNKPRSSFFREVENGLIPFELEPGRQRGRRYPKQAIDVLAKRQQLKHKSTDPTHLIFTPSSPADMWAEIQIGTSLYGEDDVVPYEKILEWRDINDEMHKSVKDEGHVVAYSCFMPLDESIMLPLIEDKIRERDIPNNTVRQWTDPDLSIYVSSLTVNPTGSKSRDREIARFLIKQTVKWALSLYRQFDIKNWYGIGATKEGQSWFESLGFTEIVSLYDGERKGYKLEDVDHPAKIISRFLRELETANRAREEAKSDSKVDSVDGRKPVETVDVGRQTGMRQKTPTHSTGHSPEVL